MSLATFTDAELEAEIRRRAGLSEPHRLTDNCPRVEPLRCEVCRAPATHKEHRAGPGFRVWCDKCVPMSGHYEYCPDPCRRLMALDGAVCSAVAVAISVQFPDVGGHLHGAASPVECDALPRNMTPCKDCGHPRYFHAERGNNRCKHGTAAFAGPINPCKCKRFQ